jgi:3-hydroxybutyryl-CoA dehydrogenase
VTTTIKQVGVVGCGLMGAGIAEVCARAPLVDTGDYRGYRVVVQEPSADLLEAGLVRIVASLDKAVARGKLAAADREATWARITGTTSIEDLGACDLIIEAVPEVMSLKRAVFARLDAVASPHAILASNTSSLAVIEMAAATRRPQQVLGLHFMQPAPVRPLLEVVPTLLTSQETLQQARAFGESLGKTVVVSQDMPGFIVDRLMVPFLLQAVEAWQQGLASQEEIDAAIHLGLGHPMGPFALMDLIGLDTVLLIADAVYAETRDLRFVASPILRRMVAAGQLGRKSGHGFYQYERGA